MTVWGGFLLLVTSTLANPGSVSQAHFGPGTMPPHESSSALPPSARHLCLRHADGTCTAVYLCGTAHVASRSCDDVRRLIRRVRPDAVAVELCSQRLCMLRDPEPSTPPPPLASFFPSSSVPSSPSPLAPACDGVTLRSSLAAVRRGDAGLLEALLTWQQARSCRMLAAAPGAEFRAALAEARACGAAFILCDRPMAVTLRRMTESLSRWQKVRLAVTAAVSCALLTPRSLRAWLDRQLSEGGGDEVLEEVERLGKAFPPLLEALIHERDRYMVARLREAASVLRPKTLVCVVGAGHVPGMVGCWGAPLDPITLAKEAVSVTGCERYSASPTVVTEDMLAFACARDLHRLVADRTKAGVPTYGVAGDVKGDVGEARSIGGGGGGGGTGGGVGIGSRDWARALRFGAGDRVLVRGPEGLVQRGRVARTAVAVDPAWFDAPEGWEASASGRGAPCGAVDRRAQDQGAPGLPARWPETAPYLVCTEQGDLVLAPEDSETCISADAFRSLRPGGSLCDSSAIAAPAPAPAPALPAWPASQAAA